MVKQFYHFRSSCHSQGLSFTVLSVLIAPSSLHCKDKQIYAFVCAYILALNQRDLFLSLLFEQMCKQNIAASDFTV